MFCSKCGRNMMENDVFCSTCGNKMGEGNELPENINFVFYPDNKQKWSISDKGLVYDDELFPNNVIKDMYIYQQASSLQMGIAIFNFDSGKSLAVHFDEENQHRVETAMEYAKKKWNIISSKTITDIDPVIRIEKKGLIGRMFQNIGTKIKTVAKINTIIGVIFGILIAIVFAGYAISIDAEPIWVVIGAIIISFVIFCTAWLTSITLYGFGELIEKTCDIEKVIRKKCK